VKLEELTMLPESEARRRLRDRELTYTLIAPPYPALGVGTLRVLRIRELAGDALEVAVGYEQYQRLEQPRFPAP
jgi:hypothetical protein